MMRRRTLVLAALVALGGAAAADRVWPAPAPPARIVRPSTPGGLWGCPYLYAGNGRAWLHLANAGVDDSRVRITYVRDDASPVVSNLSLRARRAVSIPFNTNLRRATGAVVEYAGGEVVVSRTAAVDDAGGGNAGGVGAACSRAATGTVVVPTGATLHAETVLWILNPATSDATLDVLIVTPDEELRPERLQGLVVPARSRRAVRLGDYAFDEAAAAAVVRVRSGRVVVDGLYATGLGIALLPAQEPRNAALGIAMTERGSARLDALAPGEDDVAIEASILTAGGQSILPRPTEDGVQSRIPSTFALEAQRTAAVAALFTAREGGRLVIATRWAAGTLAGPAAPRRRDIAAAPALALGRRLVAAGGPPAAGAQTKIVLANPGTRLATVTLTLLRGTEPVPLGVRTVEPGRVISFDAGRFGGVVSIEASSDAPVAMMLAGLVQQQRYFTGYAIAARPLVIPDSARVELDPRLGVPAP